MSRVCWLALLAALALGAVDLHAAEPAPASPTFSPTPGGSTATLTLALVLMVGLLGGGAYLVRNGFTLLQPKMKGARKLQISETRMLGNRQFLVVAEYEDRKMLLGVCPGRIDYLATLSAAEPEFPAIGSEKCDE
jgi:flagellar protein FliO/FliZ